MADFKPKVISSAGHDKLLDDADNLILVNAPAADSHGTNKKYVDDQINAITGGDTPTSSIYVKRSGDDMSGNLTIATDKIVLNATNGSAEFAGVVSSGGSVFLNPVNGALEVYQPNGVIDTTPAVLVQDSGDQFNAIIEGSGTIKIGGDGSFNSVANAPATRLNNDGSAEFAALSGGSTKLNQEGSANLILNGGAFRSIQDQGTYPVFHAAIEGAATYSTEILADGSATFTGDIEVGKSNLNTTAIYGKNATTSIDDATLKLLNGSNAGGNGNGYLISGLGPSAAKVFDVRNNGSATFAGHLEAASIDGGSY